MTSRSWCVRRVNFFCSRFGWKVFVILFLYRAFKEKLKIQGPHPFKLGFDFTTTCILIVYENVTESGKIKAGMGVKIIDF